MGQSEIIAEQPRERPNSRHRHGTGHGGLKPRSRGNGTI